MLNTSLSLAAVVVVEAMALVGAVAVFFLELLESLPDLQLP